MAVKTKVNSKLASLVKNYLELKSQKAFVEKALENAKDVLDEEFDKLAKNNEFQNGRLGLPGVAMVSVVMNAPKLVWEKSGVSLEPVDREGVALIVPDRFQKLDVDVAALNKAIDNGDKELKALLTKKGIAVVQDSRYQVKAA